MTIDEIYQVIATEKPSVIYVSGKTSTGKSTFARQLHERLGYQVVTLETILVSIIKSRSLDEQSTFHKVLSDPRPSQEKTLFFEATDKAIAHALHQKQPLVIEGALGNVETLRRILQSTIAHIFFIYFHPTHIATYVRNLTERFMQSSETSYAGLPLAFWQHIDDAEFKTFCATRTLTDALKVSIHQYALTSQRESLTRLDTFQQTFRNIRVVEI